MADIAKSGTPSLCTTVPDTPHLAGLLCGEAIAAGDACYIKSDGKVWESTGAAATAPAQVFGYAFQAASVGEAVTLCYDCRFRYGAGLTPGAKIYLSATAGLIGDAATTGGTAPIGVVVDATRVHLWQSIY